MGTVELAVTGTAMFATCLSVIVVIASLCGPEKHPITTWVQMYAAKPKTRAMRLWARFGVPTVYMTLSWLTWHVGWQACSVFLVILSFNWMFRGLLMNLFPDRVHEARWF